MNKKLRILGIDPGIATIGWGVIESHQKEPELLEFGCIETCKGKAAVERLEEIAVDLKEIIKKFEPDEIAVEELFFFKNAKTVIGVAQARGVLLLTCGQQGVATFEYTPLQIKQALTGYGRADKSQVQWMMKEILGLGTIPRPDDAADALAVAACHLQSRKLKLIKHLSQ